MTAISVPPRSAQQRLAALQKGNDVRMRRAVLKVDIKAGRESVPALLLSPPWWLESMRVWDLVLAQRKWGRVKVAKLFHTLGMSPSKTVFGISDRQRKLLVELLGKGSR